MYRESPAEPPRTGILDIVYAAGHASAAEVRDAMPEAPTDAAVRTTLRILVAKGHLRIERAGPRYDYWPTVPRDAARRSELQHVLRTSSADPPKARWPRPRHAAR